MECCLPGGDHEIVAGRVQGAETAGNGAAPLLYWRGGYASLGRSCSCTPGRVGTPNAVAEWSEAGC